MGISAINVAPDLNSIQETERVSDKFVVEKKQLEPVEKPSQDWSENPGKFQLHVEQLEEAIEKLNETLALHATRLEFAIHEKTKEIMVKVVDENTGEVIREVPSKKVLDMAAMTWEQLGLLVDEKA